MTLFINLRASTNGGIVAGEATAWDDGSVYVRPEEFAERTAGRDLVLATHGFNVDRVDGIEALSGWSRACELPDSFLFVGVLWPGDSAFLPVVDYVYEGVEAIASAKLLAGYLNRYAGQAQSISFASHSLGARVVLETVRGLAARPRAMILMAGAIENNCLVREYADAAAKASRIFVLASRSDLVLKWAFPPGNLVGEIIMHGHPYDRTPLGRSGPARPLPPTLSVLAWQIPDAWDYGHGDYLPKHGQIGKGFDPLPQAPGPDSKVPVDLSDPTKLPWKPAWSAGAARTQTS